MGSLPPLDLNLLVALDHLLEAGSVTGAARRAGTSQPSMSRTLSRLREVFGDPILVAAGHGMSPTERGRELAPRVQEALASVRRVLSPQEPFEPSRDRFTFRIAASDLVTSTVLCPVLEGLRRDAPGLAVHVEAISLSTIDALVRGDLDLAIGPRAPAEGVEQLVFRPLTRDRYVSVVRRGHPIAGKKLTLRRYLALEHVVVSRGTPGISPVSAALNRLGHSRRVAVTVPSFLEAAAVLAATDLTAALPERLVRAWGARLSTRPLPFAVEELSLNLVFHPRAVNDRRHKWIRERIASASLGMGGGSVPT